MGNNPSSSKETWDSVDMDCLDNQGSSSPVTTSSSSTLSLKSKRSRSNSLSSTSNSNNNNNSSVSVSTATTADEYEVLTHKNTVVQIIVMGNYLYSCSTDCNACIWDAQGGKCLKVLHGHRSAITCMHMPENAPKVLYTASKDRCVRSWSLLSGLCIYEYKGVSDNTINAMVVHENVLYCGGLDTSIRATNMENKAKVGSFSGHSKRITCLVIKDGLLYSGSRDCSVRIWDIKTRKSIKILKFLQPVEKLLIRNGLLFVDLYHEIQVYRLEDMTPMNPIIGVSACTITANNILISWNRFTRSFELYDITNFCLVHKETLKDLADPVSVSYNDNTIYFTDKNKIRKQQIQISSERNAALRYMPVFSIYGQLFHYFAEILLYPSRTVADAIEDLQLKQELRSELSFEMQIQVLADYLTKKLKNAEDQKLIEDKIKFEVQVVPQTGGETSASVYTDEELQSSFENRTEVFYQKLKARNDSSVPMTPSVVLVRRDHLVQDTLKNFHLFKPSDLVKPMFVFFPGEQGLDMGGLTREFYHLLSEQILDPRYALFTRSGVNQSSHPNPASCINEAHLDYFRFIGRLIGKAIYDSNLMDLHLTPAMFKLMVGQPLTYGDVESVDPSVFLILQQVAKLDDSSIRQWFMTFAADIDLLGFDNCVELKSGGKDIYVTEENKWEYIELYSKWKLVEGVRPQIEYLLTGLYEIIPRQYLRIFEPRELELLLCGLPEIDCEDWRVNTDYDGYQSSDQVIEWFWELVRDMGSVERSKLLQFVTGIGKVPPEGFKGMHPKFLIVKIRDDESHLPKAHTCFNRLDLPVYSTKQLLASRISTALEHGLYGFSEI